MWLVMRHHFSDMLTGLHKSRGNIIKPKLRDIPKSYWLTLFEKIKVIKDKER